MAYIEKRKHDDGKITYRARIRIQGMPEESASFPTRTLAKEWAWKKEAEMKEGRFFPRDEGKHRTFGSFVDYYIEKVLTKNPRSFAKQQQLMLFWKEHLGKYYLVHITPAMIAELRDQLLLGITRRGRQRTTSTVNRYLSSLSRAFTICVKEFRYLRENPVLMISRPKETRPRERYLEKEEITRLLDLCKKSKSPYLYPIVFFALATGARKGEILSLKWEDVDLTRGHAIFRETKNGETRVISLTPSVIQCLNEERSKRLLLSPYVFSSHDGQKPADIKSAWERVVELAKLKNLRFHDLRHTAASYLAMGGASALEIAAILGHKTLAMVKRYSHLSTTSTSEALRKMNKEILGEYLNAS